MSEQDIPAEVLSVARSHASLDEMTPLHVVEIHLEPIHRARPRLAGALHLWRVDMPGSDEIYERRDQEYLSGGEPAYTNVVLSIFVAQLADGAYSIDGINYDEDPE